MNFRRYLVLAGTVLFSSVGDVLLSHGMKSIGHITLQNGWQVIPAVFNPWVALGIVFLLAFFALYANALSWADLTYVVPATALGYVCIALLSKFFLHDNVTLLRWVGIVLVSAGVGVVAMGPERTHRVKEKRNGEMLPARYAEPEGSNG